MFQLAFIVLIVIVWFHHNITWIFTLLQFVWQSQIIFHIRLLIVKFSNFLFSGNFLSFFFAIVEFIFVFTFLLKLNLFSLEFSFFRKIEIFLKNYEFSFYTFLHIFFTIIYKFSFSRLFFLAYFSQNFLFYFQFFTSLFIFIIVGLSLKINFIWNYKRWSLMQNKKDFYFYNFSQKDNFTFSTLNKFSHKISFSLYTILFWFSKNIILFSIQNNFTMISIYFLFFWKFRKMFFFLKILTFMILI